MVHSGLGIILAGVRGVCEDGCNLDIRLKVLENLVVLQQHRDRLHREQGVEFTVEGGLAEIIDNELSDGLHPDVALLIGVELALIVFD